VYNTVANAEVLKFLRRELIHAIWHLLLTEDFMHAYMFGIIVLCADGIERRLFPQLFLYSADYREKYSIWRFILFFCHSTICLRVLLVGIKFLGKWLCPLCKCPKKKVEDLGTKADMLRREKQVRVDSEKRQERVERAHEAIFKKGRAVDSKTNDEYLEFSTTPNRVRYFILKILNANCIITCTECILSSTMRSWRQFLSNFCS
jgi:hypothetical protein